MSAKKKANGRAGQRRAANGVRLLRPDETELYATAVNLLRAEGMTKKSDPFSFRQPDELVHYFKMLGVRDAERMRSRVHVALDHGKVVGVAGVHPMAHWVEYTAAKGTPDDVAFALTRTSLSMMAVAEGRRDQGIGGQLIGSCVERARRDGFRMLFGFADGDLPSLRRFYTRHGMQMSGTGNAHHPHIFGTTMQRVRTLRQGEYFWIDLVPSDDDAAHIASCLQPHESTAAPTPAAPHDQESSSALPAWKRIMHRLSGWRGD